MVDLERLIKELVDERDRIDGIIQALEVYGKAATVNETGGKRRGRKFMSVEDRREVSERMTRYWARRRAETKKTRTAGVGSEITAPKDMVVFAAAS